MNCRLKKNYLQIPIPFKSIAKHIGSIRCKRFTYIIWTQYFIICTTEEWYGPTEEHKWDETGCGTWIWQQLSTSGFHFATCKKWMPTFFGPCSSSRGQWLNTVIKPLLHFTINTLQLDKIQNRFITSFVDVTIIISGMLP